MRRLNTADSALYLRNEHGISRTPATLRKLRCLGGGPQFRKAGRSVLYDRESLDTWAEALVGEPVASTAEVAT